LESLERYSQNGMPAAVASSNQPRSICFFCDAVRPGTTHEPSHDSICSSQPQLNQERQLCMVRSDLNLSTKELARLVGVSTSSIRRHAVKLGIPPVKVSKRLYLYPKNRSLAQLRKMGLEV
jgi:hypothetical protein